MIVINLEKARNIRREQIREERAPRFAELDVAFMRAVEMGDVTLQQSIAQQKQILRDTPANVAIDTAQTVEALKVVSLSSILAST
jgi:hypothetical protein